MAQKGKQMYMFQRLISGLGRISRDQTGTTAVLFALAIVPLLVAAGSAIDYIRYVGAGTRLQAALDSGALSAASAANLSVAARRQVGEDTFRRNLNQARIPATDVDVSFTVNNGVIEATAGLELPSSFMQIVGITRMNLEVSTEVTIPETKKAEIALVLDYSGSMTEVSGGQVKYVAMRQAARKLVTDLAAANPRNIKVGLVPFSHHVYLTMPERFIAGRTGAGSWTGCTQDRRYPHNLGDATPGADDATKWGHAFAPAHRSDGCGSYAPNRLKVAPLTDDFAAVTAQIDAMRPYAWTHIALGAEFGYHLLSPNEPFTQGAAFGDRKVQKVMVLLTDGQQTEPAFGPAGRTVSQGENNLETICENAKANGITIMTLAFDLDDKATRDRLSRCASDPARHFFVAEDSGDLGPAFDEIKRQINARVFVSR